MDERLKAETHGLIHSWMRHDARMLRDYLIQDVEDPRINVQSIFTRHFLIELLFPRRFGPLFEHEMTFALVMNWLLRLAQSPGGAERLEAVTAALLDGEEEADGLSLPPYLTSAFNALPIEIEGFSIPNYIIEFQIRRASGLQPYEDPALSTFQELWAALLATLDGPVISVVEPACGSANDYRFLHACGLGRFLNYTGFDLCEKNISNARAMFPGVDFRVGNAIEIEAPDKSFDVCYVHDLFEHLSVEAMEAAIAECCRVTRHCLCAHFFNMHAAPDHIVNPVEAYHWNTLSAPATRALFLRHAKGAEIFNIDQHLAENFGCPDTHNKNAWTFLVTL